MGNNGKLDNIPLNLSNILHQFIFIRPMKPTAIEAEVRWGGYQQADVTSYCSEIIKTPWWQMNELDMVHH